MSNDYQPPRAIWLQPWCNDCDASGERYDMCGMWAEDDPWGECDDCGRKAVKYVISEDEV